MKKTIGLITSILLVFLGAQILAQTWEVQEESSSLENPSEYNLANVKKGKELYMLNCKSCHGDPGKSNALPLVPPPPDVVSDVMQNNTEGGLYYKITYGRGGMPQFEKTLSDDDRWRIVNFIMNYNPQNEQLLSDEPPKKAKIIASINEAERKIKVFTEVETVGGVFSNLANTPVQIGRKTAFGNLNIGEATTDENGNAEFLIPENIVSDHKGLASMVVSLGDEFDAAAAVLENAKLGEEKVAHHIIRKGVIWSTNENTPLFVKLAYFGAVGLVWLAIGYVLLQILRIRKLSKA